MNPNDLLMLVNGVLAVTQGVAGSAIWALVKSKFVAPDQVVLIEAVEASHGSDDAKKALEAALKDMLRADAEFAEELAGLLLLVPWQARVFPSEGASEAQLLTPYRLFTDLIGREKDMGELHAWANSDKPIAIRVLAGGAGSGKTRIALELMRLLESSSDGGWHAGFLKADDIEQFSVLGARGNTLAVVDYAATASGHLKKWFEHLADSVRTDGRLRILLLEREAQRDTGWWETLTSVARSQSHERLEECFDPDGPKALRRLGETDRRELFQGMLGKAAGHLGRAAVPLLPAPGENESFDKQLAEQRWGEPLYLMMAALVALLPGGPDVVGVLSLNRADLAGKMAEHEITRLERFASGHAGPTKAVWGMAAQATLCRGIPADTRIDAATEELASLGLLWPDGPGALADVMTDALPGPGGGIGFVEPDIVGEAFVLQALPKVYKSKQREAILRAARRAQTAAIGSVIRTIQDFSADDVPEPMDWLKALIEVGAADDPSLLYAIQSAMPRDTLQLLERAVEVTQLLLDRLAPESEHTGDTGYLAERARLLSNLSNRLSDAGKRDEALMRASEAAGIHEQLARSNPDAFLPNFAMCLNNLAKVLSDVGRRDEALEKALEAARIYEQLARSNPAAFLPDLAMSLSTLATALSKVGRRVQALEKASEVTRIYEQLAASNPGAFLPYLAMSLNNLTNTLGELGRRDEALEKASEAVRIRRQLARSNPDAFLPCLALSINTLAVMLSDLGRRDEALENASEATRIYEQLAGSNPDAFLPYLAISVNNLARALSEVGGRDDDALEKASQAAQIYEELARSNPDAFLPDLAMSHNTLAAMLSQLGRLGEALERASEAVRIREQLAGSNPDAFLPDLAGSLNNLAAVLSGVGRGDEALEKASKAVRIYEQLARTNPHAFLHRLAVSLAVRADCLSGLARYAEAVETSAHALESVRKPLEQTPAAFSEIAAEIIRVYLRAAKAAGVEPDAGLASPVLQILQSLRDPGGEGKPTRAERES